MAPGELGRVFTGPGLTATREVPPVQLPPRPRLVDAAPRQRRGQHAPHRRKKAGPSRRPSRPPAQRPSTGIEVGLGLMWAAITVATVYGGSIWLALWLAPVGALAAASTLRTWEGRTDGRSI